MVPADIIGSAAAVLTTASFFPQALHVLRTRDTRAISLMMYALFTAGVALWGAYGLVTMQWSIIAANGVTIVLAVLILSLKVRDVFASRRARAIAS
ncbi:MAG TPA: SemiSWEET transporter [Hyphomonadaceae bacterium]|jgi:MtN3 and saliva related transmembrane protein